VLDEVELATATRTRCRLGLRFDHRRAHDDERPLGCAARLEREESFARSVKLRQLSLCLASLRSCSWLFGHAF